MPTDPATTSQVQAYRFVLRRMESALVRKDAVMLHEAMRHHLRATAVGVVLGVMGLVAAFMLGGFGPSGDLSANEIVIDESESVYVVSGDPLSLIAVPNVPSARLLLVALAPGRDAPAPRRVATAALSGLRRLPAVGLPFVPPLPAPENLIKGVWSVCDGPGPQPAATVLIQERPPAAPALRDDQALLVTDQAGTATYLLRREGRAQIDPHDPAIRNTFRLAGVVPRKISTGLLNAIPLDRHPLTLPPLPAARPIPQLPGSQTGDVVWVKGVQDSYYLLLPQGKQLVEHAVADLIRFQRSRDPEPAVVTPEAIARVPDVAAEDALDYEGFPARAPQILKDTEASAACLTWPDPNRPPAISLNPDGVPLAKGQNPVPADHAATGPGADFVFLPPSQGALVRSVLTGQNPDRAPIWLVTDQGTRYGVPSIEVARALGLGETTTPAPERILALLPIGDPLDPQRIGYHP
ncbi:MAG TPA: type VII secretion protein EccB [Pseudonocardiaceae bacterium]|nr:type VII secretion protein EccB [Pseudonocardiaceae bacterium]